MRHLKVRWFHDHLDEPTLLYSELDAANREVRKVEIFADGSAGFADRTESSGGTTLAEAALPTLEEIAGDTQFEPAEIGRAAFEEAWSAAHQTISTRES